MIKIYESNLEDKSFEYMGYTISDRGNWVIDDIGREFESDIEAMKFIDDLLNEQTDSDDGITLENFKKENPKGKFKMFVILCDNGEAHNYMVGEYGFCILSSSSLLLFKTLNGASEFIESIKSLENGIYRNYKKFNYSIRSVTISDGLVLDDFD